MLRGAIPTPDAILERDFTPSHTDAVARTLRSKVEEAVSVTDFGAPAGGSADDTTALVAAFAHCSATGATLIVPPGDYTTTQKLAVTSGFRLLGAGDGDATATATQPAHVSAITWIGANDETDYVIDVKAEAANEYVYGFYIDGVAIKGANKAYGGLRFSSTRHCGFGKIWIERCRVTHFQIDDSNGVLNASTEGGFVNMVAGSNAATLNAEGIVFFGSGNGVTQPNIGRIAGTMQDGDVFVLGNCDSGLFGHVQTGASGAGFYGLRLKGATDGNAIRSRKNKIEWYAGGHVFAETDSQNIIHWINSEGTSVTVEAGASLNYGVIDRNDGRRWQAFAYNIDAHVDLLVSTGYATTGSPALTLYGGHNVQGVAFDAAATERWQWVVPPSRRFSGGRIIGVKGWGIKSTATNDGDVELELSVRTALDNQGTGGAATTQTLTHSVDAASSATLEPFEITFSTPVDFQADGHAWVKIARLGGDAADTYPDDWALLSLKLIYEADVADSDSDGQYRYQPSDDSA